MVLPPADQSPALTTLERAVLETALSGTDGALRAQIDVVTVQGRTPSGVGFMTKLHVPDDFESNTGETVVPIVAGRHPDLPSGAEFVLQVKGGRLNSLEAYCHEGMWPADESGFEIGPAANGSAA